MYNSLYSVWLFFLQSHTACKGNWIQEYLIVWYLTTYDKSPLPIPLPLVATAMNSTTRPICHRHPFPSAVQLPVSLSKSCLHLIFEPAARRYHTLSRFRSGLSYCMRPGLLLVLRCKYLHTPNFLSMPMCDSTHPPLAIQSTLPLSSSNSTSLC